MNGSAIDTSTMLTVLGIVAAVWAVVPGTARLSFRLSMAWWDWIVIWGGILTVHILMFEEVLRAIDFYPNLGPWRWGFDKSGASYLLFFGLAAYIYFRAQQTRLNRRKLPLFESLATSLLHTRKFEELATLLDHHLESALKIANASSVRGRLERWLRPETPMPTMAYEDGRITFAPGGSQNWIVRVCNWFRARLADIVGPPATPQRHARAVVKIVLSSREMVAYLATARPFLCVQVMEGAGAILEEFQDEFFEALLANEASILYSELKDSQNLASSGHRLALPSENRLLTFYMKDVEVAARLGVYRSMGEAVLARIGSDDVLVRRLNGPMLTYQQVGIYRCPVYAGIYFFRVMVLEGIHQRIGDHLWLHYVTHIADRIVAGARPLRPDDDNHEFATPLSFLLYQLVNVTTDWIEESIYLTKKGAVVSPDSLDGEHVYIAFEAAEALGGVLQPILRSDRVTSRLKRELFECVLYTLRRIQQQPQLGPLAAALVKNVIAPYGMSPRGDYMQALRACYDAADHVLRADAGRFKDALEAAEGGIW